MTDRYHLHLEIAFLAQTQEDAEAVMRVVRNAIGLLSTVTQAENVVHDYALGVEMNKAALMPAQSTRLS